MPARPRRRARGVVLAGVAGIAGLLVLADQASKAWVVQQWGPFAAGHHQPVIPGLIDLDYVENRGAAFGLFQNGGWVLGAVALVVIAGILYMVPRLPVHPGGTSRLLLLALGLVLGGAVGNLIDRAQHVYVVDFITPAFARVTVGGTLYRFPTFNIADSAITMGVVLLLLGFWLLPDAARGHALDEHDATSGATL